MLQEAALRGVVSIDKGATAFACHRTRCTLQAIHLMNVIRWKQVESLNLYLDRRQTGDLVSCEVMINDCQYRDSGGRIE